LVGGHFAKSGARYMFQCETI